MSKAAAKPSSKQNAWTKPLKQKQQSHAPPPGLPPPSVDDVALRDRFLNVMVNMAGQKVVITLKTDGGYQLEGILHTATPFSKIANHMRDKYLLKAAVVVKGKPSKTIEPNTTVLIKMEDVVQVHCKSIKLASSQNTNGNGASFTDTEISDAGTGPRKGGLQQAGSAWTSAPESRPTPAATGDIKGSIGGWDQFKANEHLFNVKASYDENMYTTELDKSAIAKSDLQKAERLAKEIEKTASTNMHIAEERNQVVQGDYDEEDRYSGVLKRKPSGSNSNNNNKPAMNYAAAASKTSESGAAPPGFDSSKEETKKEATESEEAKKEEAKAPSSSDQKEESKSAEKKEDADDPKEKPKSKLSATAKSFTFNPTAKTFTPSTNAQQQQQPVVPMQQQQQHMHHPPQFIPPHPMQPGMVPMYARYPYPVEQPHIQPQAIPAPPQPISEAPSNDGSNDGQPTSSAAVEDAAASGTAEGEGGPPQPHPQQQQQQMQPYPGMAPPQQYPGHPPHPPHGYQVPAGAYMHPGIHQPMYRPGYGPVVVRPPFSGYGVPPPHQGYYYEDDGNYANGGRGRGRGRSGGRGRGGRNGGRGGGRGGRGNDNRQQQQSSPGDEPEGGKP